MDFTPGEEQLIIQRSARNLFAGECPRELLHRAWEDPDAARGLYDKHLADWTGLADQPLADVVLFMQEHGRAAAPGVFFATLLAAFAAVEAEDPLSTSATLAVSGADGLWRPHGNPLKHFVPCAGQVEEVIVVGGSPGEPRLARVSVEQLAVQPVEQFDRLRPLAVVDTSAAGDWRSISAGAWQRVEHKSLVACAAELVGAGRYLLDTALEYAGERQQFGRPIGTFQGLQWKLVDAATELERSAAAVAYAAMCVDAGDAETSLAVHSAKADAGAAARHCARTSMQVHGGIGYTFEHGLHFWLRRAYAGDAFMGPQDYHAAQVARLLFAA